MQKANVNHTGCEEDPNSGCGALHDQSDDGGCELNKGALAGIVIAVTAGVAIVIATAAALAFLYLRRRRRINRAQANMVSGEEELPRSPYSTL